MKIEVAIQKNENPKARGDLLEELTKKLLEAQNYEVETEVRNTGMELDLLCKQKANKSKKVYVECKAYKDTNKIQSDVIKNIVGIKNIENYSEVWLISTSEFGKDAKGLVGKIESDETQSQNFTFYTPMKLVEALQNSNTICSADIAKSKIKSKVNNKLGNNSLLLTKYGYFYLFEHLEGGTANDVYVFHAKDCEIVEDELLLENLKNTDNSYNSFSFKKNLTILEGSKDISKIVLDTQDDILKLNEVYLKSINDTGIKLTHRNKNELTLSDIFVYQDLQEIEKKNKVKINSSELLNITKNSKCMIFGEEVSGKTALICSLQRDYNEKKMIPIFIDAQKVKSSDLDKFELLIANNFNKQYKEINEKEFKSLLKKDIEKIIILIDNFESLGIKKAEYKAKFLEMICENFSNVLIFSDDSAEMEILTKEDFKSKLKGFKFFKIKEYGFQLRDMMIEKWLSIGIKEVISDNNLLERKDEVCRVLETIIGNKFIPTYPLYIITLLQQIEAGTSSNLGGSAYAEFYNYLIVQAMGSTKIKPDELDFYHTYLSFIAFHYFEKERRELEKIELEELHEKYSKEYHKKSFSIVYENLINAKLIKENNEFYSFGHNYIYYFYVAKYLSDNMEKRGKSEEIKNKIDDLIKKLYRTEYANIIIFLIHHSKTRAENIIDKIMYEAKQIFKETTPSNLSKEELSKINEFVTEEIHLTIEEKNPHEHRQKNLQFKDNIQETNDEKSNDLSSPNYSDEIKELDIFGKINLSMKLMEILGQIAKNYYGSLSRKDKNELLGEVCALGLRNLNLFIKNVCEYRDMLEKEIQEEIEKKNIESEGQKEQISRKVIVGFTELICMHFIKKISSNIASKNLFEDIEKLSYDSEAMKLINIATKLDFPNGLNIDKTISLNSEFTNSNNHIPKELLRFFVVEHFYKFDVEYKKKQEVCSKLKISIATQKNILINKSKGK
jgi:hypothetical protein